MRNAVTYEAKWDITNCNCALYYLHKCPYSFITRSINVRTPLTEFPVSVIKTSAVVAQLSVDTLSTIDTFVFLTVVHF